MSVPDGLLVLLQEGPKHGYQLASDFSQRTAGSWSLNTGQVYTTLDRLARDTFIEPEPALGEADDTRRRLWRLTPEGRDRAAQWLEAVPPRLATRDELVLRVLLVAAVDPAAARELIVAQRRGLVGHLQALRKAQRAADDLLARMAADADAVRLESDVRWLDLSEERLRRAPTNASPHSIDPALSYLEDRP